ncbi:DUF5719 family protein [Agromyces soli]
MPDSRTLLRAGGRGLAVLGAVVLTAGALGAAAFVPWPEHRAEPLSRSIQPAESRQQRVCPGPVLELGDDAESVRSLGPAELIAVTQPEGVATDRTPLAPADDAGGSGDESPVLLSTAPGAVDAGMLAGAQSQQLDTETVAGFVAAGCVEPVAEAWLVGGSTELGRTTLLLLANPGEVAASVDVRVSTETGAVDAPAGLGVLVEPGTQRVVSLAGLAPGSASLVVHVTSSGATIAASLEQTSIDGLAPSGVELIGTAAAPAESQVIPGVVVPQAGGLAVDEDHPDGDAHPAVRLLAPGTDSVEATVSVLPESGAEGQVFDVVLQPGMVSDIPLGELAAGEYTVRVDAEGPVVAAARATTAAAGEAAVDLAWFPSSLPLLDQALVAVPDGDAPELHLANPGAEDATVELGSGDTVVVPAGGAASVAVRSGDGVLLDGAKGVHASVVFSSERRLAAFAVQPPGPLEAPIVVYPR